MKSYIFKLFKILGIKNLFYYFSFFYKNLFGIKPMDYLILKSFYQKYIKKDQLVFDVGANIGNRALVFRDLGARVIAFEPNPDLFSVLKYRFGDSIEIVNKGIGLKNEILEFNIASNNLVSSFSKKFSDLKGKSNSIKYDKSIKVPISSLDSVILEFGKPVFCKIDTEGFEEQVIAGLSQPIPMLSFEFTFPEFYNETINCINHLNKIGYNKFNLSFDESLLFQNDFMDYHTFLNYIYQFKESNNGCYGDIYAMSNS